jgi:hypothetical protein
MAALDFPINPSDGDLYGNYVYNDARGVWDIYTPLVAARFTASATKPSPAQNGDAWFDVTDGVTYIYYDDGSSAQWVETGSPVVSFDAVSTLTDTEITSVLDGQILVYDSATSKWINETPASTLEGLSDTVIYDAIDGEVLTYSSGDWVNQTITPDGFTSSTIITSTNASWPVPALASPIIKVTVMGAGGGGSNSGTAGSGGSSSFNAGLAGTVTAAGGLGAIASGDKNGTPGMATSNGGQGHVQPFQSGITTSVSSMGRGGAMVVQYLDLTGISTVNVTIGAGGAPSGSGGSGGRGEVLVEYVAG